MNPINIAVIILFPTAVFLIVWGLGQQNLARLQEKEARRKIMGGSADDQIRLDRFEQALERTGLAEKLEVILTKAYLRISPLFFLGAVAGAFSLVFITLWAYLSLRFTVNFFFSLSTTILAAWIYLNNRKTYYLDEFVKQMPQVAVILSNAMKAGMTVTQAIQLAASRVSWPAKQEFERVSYEIALGFTVEDALRRLTERVDLEEIRTIATTITVLRQSGGNLAQALSIMAGSIVARERVRAEVKTMTSEARFTAIVLLLLPMLVLFTINVSQDGAVTRFLDRPAGMVIMAIFIAVQFGTYFMINKFAEIKV